MNLPTLSSLSLFYAALDSCPGNSLMEANGNLSTSVNLVMIIPLRQMQMSGSKVITSPAEFRACEWLSG